MPHPPTVDGPEGPPDRSHGDPVDDGGPLPHDLHAPPPAPPQTQHRIDAKRYDFAWPQQHVVVETDSWLAHSTPYAFQADRSQTNALQLAGWLVLRFTWADLARRSRKVAATVERALTR